MNTLLTIEELCKKLKPLFGKKIDKIYLKYRLTDNLEEKREIEQAISALFHKYLNEGLLNEKILLEPPSEDVMKGEYPLAMVSYADNDIFPFALREQDWVRHVCISGMSGSGKTTLAFQIVGNFIKHKKPFIIFDWKKSFRPLLLVDKGILCFTVGNENISNLFKININKPPKGVPPKEWLNVLCDLITESFFASYGVHKLLLETLDKAFTEFGVYEGSENYPNWYQIKDRLEEKAEKTKRKSRESEWLVSTLRIAHALTFGSFGEAINHKDKSGLATEELLDKKIIFELNSLGNTEKKFFCEFLLTYLYKHKKANEVGFSERFKNAIIVDEAHNIFLKDRPHFVNECVTDMIYREIREYGVGLICLDQHISKLSDTVAGNSACNIAFQQMLAKDVECVSGIMQLRDNRQFFSMLPVGSAIVKLAERYYKPFLIQVPFVDLKNEAVSDAMLKDRMSNVISKVREYKQFEAESDVSNVTKELARMNEIFKRSGVDTKHVDRDIEELIPKEEPKKEPDVQKISQIAQKLVDEDVKRKEAEERAQKRRIIPRYFVTNHLQAYIVEYLREQLKHGYSLDVLKQHLLAQGYKSFDVIRAISHLRNVPEELQVRDAFAIRDVNTTEQSLHKQKVYKHAQVQKSYSLNEKQKQVLEFISKRPYMGTAQIYRFLNLSARKGNKLRKELIGMGLLKVEEQRNDKGWKKILLPTATAITALENPEIRAE